ncbi:MAG: multifunctional CCA addition/repair protein [Gammaproteobacteria bacterium]
MKIYEVGGAVRDDLLGRTVADRDWVVVGSSEAELKALGYRRVGADFPVFLHPQTKEEYALARTERKSGHGYKGFVTDSSESVSLEDDLARRDFTVNAMARAADGTIFDPFGGQDDLAARVLRHVGPAFVEDPLRLLRAARFSARLDFSIAPETMDLMQQITASGELETIAPERVWQELRAALNTDNPRCFIEVLRECGALAALMPEIDRLFGVPQPEKYHPEIDTGLHILLVLDQTVTLGADEAVRFAALVHDLGKGTTPAEILPSHRGHEVRGVELIDEFCDRLRVPREHRELATIVSRLHTQVHRALEMRPGKLLQLLEEADAFRRNHRFEQMLLACKIDATGRTGLSHLPYEQIERLRQAYAVSKAIGAGDVEEPRPHGRELAVAIRQKRLAAITRSGI